jgi:hypothetical protein
MTTQWFPDDLGLSEDASVQSVKLAAIEPLPRQDLTADPRIVAQKFVRALGDDLKRGRWATEACERRWHGAQATHPEAGLLFEIELLDALVHTRLPDRRILFLAAYKLCRWSKAEHVQSLGTNGPWIALVLAQEAAMRAAYETLPPAVKLLRLLEDSDDRIPERTLAQWPRMREIFLAYPQYLSLTIDSTRFKAWNAAYRELQERPASASQTAIASRSSPPPMPQHASPVTPSVDVAQQRPPRAQHPAWASWMIKRRDALIVCTAAFCVMVYLVSRIAAPAERSARPGLVAPSPSLILTLPEHSRTDAENCGYIDLVVHQPTWKLPQAAEQQRRFAELITGCMKANHWHARTAPDAVLERLGVHT